MTVTSPKQLAHALGLPISVPVLSKDRPASEKPRPLGIHRPTICKMPFQQLFRTACHSETQDVHADCAAVWRNSAAGVRKNERSERPAGGDFH